MSDPTIHEIRRAGGAVVVFSLEELGQANPDEVEERLVELGNEVIAILNGVVEEDE